MDTVDMKMSRRIEDAQVSISTIISDKQELSSEIKNTLAMPQVTIRDREYLESKTKGMIDRCELMLNRLEESFEPTTDDEGKIKVNFSLYGVDVYAKIVNAVAVQVRELRELNRMVMGIDVINAEGMMKSLESKKEDESKTVKLTSSDLLKLIKEAGNNNQMNAINAEFKILKTEPKENANEPV